MQAYPNIWIALGKKTSQIISIPRSVPWNVVLLKECSRGSHKTWLLFFNIVFAPWCFAFKTYQYLFFSVDSGGRHLRDSKNSQNSLEKKVSLEEWHYLQPLWTITLEVITCKWQILLITGCMIIHWFHFHIPCQCWQWIFFIL